MIYEIKEADKDRYVIGDLCENCKFIPGFEPG